MTAPLLQIRGLRTHFFTESGVAKAVDGVDLDIMKGEVLGLVGESGSGKSVTALSILRLIPDPPGRIVGGEIRFNGHDLLDLSWEDIRKVRGKEISMIFQEPMTSLNPVFTIGRQVTEVILAHRAADGPDAVAAYTASVRSVAPGAVVAIDEEGGDVTRLHVPDGSPVLGPLALGAAADLDLTRAIGRAIGLELAGLGITLDEGVARAHPLAPRTGWHARGI